MNALDTYLRGKYSTSMAATLLKQHLAWTIEESSLSPEERAGMEIDSTLLPGSYQGYPVFMSVTIIKDGNTYTAELESIAKENWTVSAYERERVFAMLAEGVSRQALKQYIESVRGPIDERS
jgi:hypothetical protein